MRTVALFRTGLPTLNGWHDSHLGIVVQGIGPAGIHLIHGDEEGGCPVAQAGPCLKKVIEQGADVSIFTFEVNGGLCRARNVLKN